MAQEHSLDEPHEVELFVHTDERGTLMDVWPERYGACVNAKITMSAEGVFRGFHWQDPNPQGKLVICLAGIVCDFALKPETKTMMGAMLTGGSNKGFWIPRGWAHGFRTISKTSVVAYYCDAPYDKASEKTINWSDL